MSSRHIFLAGIICLLVFLFACNNEPEHTIAPPPDNVVDSTGANTPNSTVPVVQNEHTHTIEISKMKFNPDNLTIPSGDTVVWINNDITNHCVTEINKGWTSGTLTPNQSFKKVVTKSTDYFCAIHMVMKGKVVVQ
jgi:plastocyanin